MATLISLIIISLCSVEILISSNHITFTIIITVRLFLNIIVAHITIHMASNVGNLLTTIITNP